MLSHLFKIMTQTRLRAALSTVYFFFFLAKIKFFLSPFLFFFLSSSLFFFSFLLFPFLLPATPTITFPSS